MKLLARGRIVEFPRIVNLSVDSFSGDGLDDVDAALAKARGLIANGADIIDLGAESARTNRPAISEKEEAERLCAFIARWNAESHAAMLSINTWRPSVAKAALEVGGDILNDISALPTDENARICAGNGVALLIMHSLGEPKVPHTHIGYDDIMARLEAFFVEKIALAEKAGVPRESLILDPGIDFAKQREDNLRIFRELARLRSFGLPILLPVSRKTVIGEVLGLPNAAERYAGTVACIVQGMLQGASIFRVHNVRATVQTLRILAAVEQS